MDFLLFWKRDKVSCTIAVAVEIQSLVLDKELGTSLEVPLIAPVKEKNF